MPLLLNFQTVKLHVRRSAPLWTSHGGECQLNRNANKELMPTPMTVKSGHLELPVPLSLFLFLRPSALSEGQDEPRKPARSSSSRAIPASALKPDSETERARREEAGPGRSGRDRGCRREVWSDLGGRDRRGGVMA